MTAILDHLDTQVEDRVKLTEDEVSFCDQEALKYLMISPKELSRFKEEVPRLQSVYYRESSADGGALLVCTDGSILFAGSFISRGCHIMAFENGLRTSSTLLLERKNSVLE